MGMNPNEFGKKLGIGLRVAGRIAQQRVQESGATPSYPPGPGSAPNPPNPPRYSMPSVTPQSVKQAAARSHTITRAAGRGIGGFLRPFGKVGGLLWLEVTGFFFGVFALFFAQSIWRARLDYASGPQHTRFLIAVALTALFAYLSISAFWRARRR